MSKLTRGNVLATLKELKKHPRPKISNPTPASVQAICGQTATNKSNKVVDLKATLERRRAILCGGRSVDVAKFIEQYTVEFEEFCAMLKAKCSNNKVSSK